MNRVTVRMPRAILQAFQGVGAADAARTTGNLDILPRLAQMAERELDAAAVALDRTRDRMRQLQAVPTVRLVPVISAGGGIAWEMEGGEIHEVAREASMRVDALTGAAR